MSSHDTTDVVEADVVEEAGKTLTTVGRDKPPETTILAEGRLEVRALMPDGRREFFDKDKRIVELVGGQGAGSRVVVTNLWTKVKTVLPADAVVKIYP